MDSLTSSASAWGVSSWGASQTLLSRPPRGLRRLAVHTPLGESVAWDALAPSLERL